MDALRRQVLQPQVAGLGVGPEALFLAAGEICRVQAVGRQMPDLRQQFPRPVDGFGLEVVAEAPVAEHLEKRVVVAVVADVFKVVVLAAGADALLRVDRPDVVALLPPEEDVLELVHAGVGEKQRRVFGRQQRAGRHERVAAILEKLDVLSPDVFAGFLHVFYSKRSYVSLFPVRRPFKAAGVAENDVCVAAWEGRHATDLCKTA